MSPKELMDKGEQMMTICNACRYCEGFCAVWRAMEYRRQFSEKDLNYLANLCHDCGDCYYACQYAPPHEWEINPPLMFSKIRKNCYEKYAWPRFLSSIFQVNGLAVGLLLALSIMAFLFGVSSIKGEEALSTAMAGGDFYQLTSHGFLVTLFGLAAIFSLLSLVMGLVRFCRDLEAKPGDLLRPATLTTALKETLRMEYLDGGGWGCAYPGEESSQLRRWFHHLTFYGFLLCFAATAVAAIYNYIPQFQVPYGYFSLPVILGTLGGIGLLIGPAGLLALKCFRNRDIADSEQWGMDAALILLLFLSAASGLLLLFLRETMAMGFMLVIHLGTVMTLFLTMPYGKFVHGLYRFLALANYAVERKQKSR